MQGRLHIEFFQAQLLPWRRIGSGASWPDVEVKFLSRDPGTGACSLLARYPAGWHREGTEYLEASEEFYVLDGEIQVNRQGYGNDCYAYLPRHWPRSAMRSDKGAVVLAFYDREPVLRHGAAPQDVAQDTVIPFIDATKMPWDMTLNDPNLRHLGISRKNLRTDPLTGERTFLSLVLPHSAPDGDKGPREIHPCVEEAYVLSGALSGPHGVMYPGGYFWRPAGIPHGPFGAHWGSVSLMRFVGGRHQNVWTADQAPFRFDAPYQPILPEELAYLARQAWVPPPAW
jgi:hypothetical protein